MTVEGSESKSISKFDRDFVPESWGCNLEGLRADNSGHTRLTDDVEVARVKFSGWVMDAKDGSKEGWRMRVEEFM
jgi:hypothetical protein